MIDPECYLWGENFSPRKLKEVIPSIQMREEHLKQERAVGDCVAWQRFFQIGDALAASDQPNLPTLTQTVQLMRR